jgi:hypothetical protein
MTRMAGAGGGALVLAGSGYAGYRWPHDDEAKADSASSTTQAATGDDAVAPFVSRPDLRPPLVAVTRPVSGLRRPKSAAQYVFVTPKGYEVTGPGEAGLMVLDDEGRLVWFLPRPDASTSPFDLQVQSYQGRPVLTWWQGTVISGYGRGVGYLYDSSYRQIASVKAGNGLDADLHELNLTPQGTALITTYRTAAADLSELGGPTHGQVLAGQAQEIDVATGRLLFSWDSLDHVPVSDTYQSLSGGTKQAPFDYFHINSVSVAPDGDLLISARNTWTVYKVSRSNGKIVWRLNGRQSDFEMGPGARFYWQHHVRALSGNQITLFDDGSSPAQEVQSRGLRLRLDTRAGRAELVGHYVHPARLLAANQGSMQVLGDGRVFIGWGNQPYFSEFLKDGTLVLDGRFPADDQSYRAFAFDWTGRPDNDPVVAVKADTTGGVTVYASWNGATEIDTWRVLAGKSPKSLDTVATAGRAGFETVISVNSSAEYFAASALDVHGVELGRSQAVRHA